MRRVSRLLICIPQRRAGIAARLRPRYAGSDALRALKVVGLIRAVGQLPLAGAGRLRHKKSRSRRIPCSASLRLAICALGARLACSRRSSGDAVHGLDCRIGAIPDLVLWLHVFERVAAPVLMLAHDIPDRTGDI